MKHSALLQCRQSMYRHVARKDAISRFRSRPLLIISQWAHLARVFGSVVETKAPSNHIPFRKLLKDEAKRRRVLRERNGSGDDAPCSDRWELTVGIEVHAQLNTDHKLFSMAATSLSAEANSHASVFDLALPGSQPIFQKGAIIPAIRAALAFDCSVITKSRFDRKHYFYPDQPAGYQITQFYEPFAIGGGITVYEHDGIAAEDGKSVFVGLKQIQLEQDTAKTIHQAPSTSLLDFNRVSHPLIEIITLPQIHHPQTAAACVRKIQSMLQAVSAVTTGMEMGGLRADVNVSVRSKAQDNSLESYTYGGIKGLGQRTEIKNLNSFKAVEDAIIAERDRQIKVLEAGGKVEGETRGWSLGSTETTRLRGKEGEVDYRYMPDPDLPPLIIDPKLVEHISKTLPKLPETSTDELVSILGLTLKDAKTLTSIDDGARLDYFDGVLEALNRRYPAFESTTHAKIVANWVLHELGGLLSTSERPFSENEVAATSMASIIGNLIDGCITGRTAKQLLVTAFDGDCRDINIIIAEENLALEALPREKYLELAQELIRENEKMVQQIKVKGHHKKLNWFVGQMMRQGKGKIEASKAEATLKEILGL